MIPFSLIFLELILLEFYLLSLAIWMQESKLSGIVMLRAFIGLCQFFLLN